MKRKSRGRNKALGGGATKTGQVSSSPKGNVATPSNDDGNKEIDLLLSDVAGIESTAHSLQYRDHPPTFDPKLKGQLETLYQAVLDIYHVFYPAVDVKGLVQRLIDHNMDVISKDEEKTSKYVASQRQANSAFIRLSAFCLSENARPNSKALVGPLDLHAWFEFNHGMEDQFKLSYLNLEEDDNDFGWKVIKLLGKMKELIRRGGELQSALQTLMESITPDLMTLVFLGSVSRFGMEKYRDIPVMHLAFSKSVAHLKLLEYLAAEMREILRIGG